jgi:hypothetical protein
VASGESGAVRPGTDSSSFSSCLFKISLKSRGSELSGVGNIMAASLGLLARCALADVSLAVEGTASIGTRAPSVTADMAGGLEGRSRDRGLAALRSMEAIPVVCVLAETCSLTGVCAGGHPAINAPRLVCVTSRIRNMRTAARPRETTRLARYRGISCQIIRWVEGY